MGHPTRKWDSMARMNLTSFSKIAESRQARCWAATKAGEGSHRVCDRHDDEQVRLPDGRKEIAPMVASCRSSSNGSSPAPPTRQIRWRGCATCCATSCVRPPPSRAFNVSWRFPPRRWSMSASSTASGKGTCGFANRPCAGSKGCCAWRRRPGSWLRAYPLVPPRAHCTHSSTGSSPTGCSTVTPLTCAASGKRGWAS